MKKILVLSDSHSALSFMRLAIVKIKPDAIVHLGDLYEDGETIAFENPTVPYFGVPGNCDKFRCFGKPELLCLPVCGVRLYMVHGHNQGVKGSLYRLLKEAREMGAQAALYGHTHRADCHREEDGLWVVNPGTCGCYGGSVALLEVEDGQILKCRILESDWFTW